MGPSVEASGEPLRLFAHQGAEQLPGHLRLLGAKALDVDLEIEAGINHRIVRWLIMSQHQIHYNARKEPKNYPSNLISSIIF